jgi:hypothetical protein
MAAPLPGYSPLSLNIPFDPSSCDVHMLNGSRRLRPAVAKTIELNFSLRVFAFESSGVKFLPC